MSTKSIYCVYLTVFSGSELPPFYIGSSNENRIAVGYHGSVKSIEYEKIWNFQLKNFPEKFQTTITSRHKTRKEAARREHEILKFFDAANNVMYINKSNAGSDFFAGQKHTQDTKNKMSVSHRGKPKSSSHSKNISKSLKGKPKSKEQIEKMVATRQSNGTYKTPWNKGKKTGQIPWNKGLTKDTDDRLKTIANNISIGKLSSNKSKRGSSDGILD